MVIEQVCIIEHNNHRVTVTKGLLYDRVFTTRYIVVK